MHWLNSRVPAAEGTVFVSASHNELAQLSGKSRAHVTLTITMGRLRHRGLAGYEREGLIAEKATSMSTEDSSTVRFGLGAA